MLRATAMGTRRTLLMREECEDSTESVGDGAGMASFIESDFSVYT